MEGISGTNEAQESQAQVDPWEAAFAALEPKGEEDNQATSDAAGNVGGGDGDEAGDASDTGNADGVEAVSDTDEAVDDASSEADPGGLDNAAGSVGGENGNAFDGLLGITEESIQQYEQQLEQEIRDRTVKEVAAEFLKRDDVRSTNGVLGATLDDPDICKRDSDGVPRFYNPETGREFTGENPRRQAKEWCEDYNRDLAQAFNNVCQQYEEHLRKESSPKLAVRKFAPKYEKLDPIRKGMLDNVIEDYEVKDGKGKVIGYSCDLDKALALVDRQITMIQGYAKKHQQDQQPNQQNQSNGPALDMKTSSGAIPSGEQAPAKSLAEAMERLQDQQLAKLKK